MKVLKLEKDKKRNYISNKLLLAILILFLISSPTYGLSIKSICFNVRDFFTNTTPQAKTNLKKGVNANKILIRNVSFNSLRTPRNASSYYLNQIVGIKTSSKDEIKPEVIGKALFYPSPLRQSEGGQLGYRLSKDMDLEIHIYDMFANLIFKDFFYAGGNGGKGDYNKLDLDLSTFDQFYLSTGVYFYLLIHNGKVLTKGKFAVVP
jgi:hypothetical protein